MSTNICVYNSIKVWKTRVIKVLLFYSLSKLITILCFICVLIMSTKSLIKKCFTNESLICDSINALIKTRKEVFLLNKINNLLKQTNNEILIALKCKFNDNSINERIVGLNAYNDLINGMSMTPVVNSNQQNYCYLYSINEDISNDCKLFKCRYNDCNYNTKNKSHLEEHIRRHLDIKEYSCVWPECG